MKSLTLMGAALLLGLVACQREPSEVNPNYNPGEDAVKTQFILNVSTGNGSTETKQDGKVAQVSGTTGVQFRGIQDAFLLPLTQPTNGIHLAADMDATSLIDLSDVLNASGLTSHKARVMDVMLPVTTNTLLFYAKAPKGDITAYARDEGDPYYGMNERDIFGHLDNYNIGKDEGSANFRLGIRMANTTEQPDLVDRFNDAETLLQAIMNVIINMDLTVAHGTHDALGVGQYGYALNAAPGVFNPDATDGFSYPEIKWSDYGNVGGLSPVYTTHAQYSLEAKLRSVYLQMTTTSTGELRASSGQAVIRIMSDLWSVINEVRCATPAHPAESVAKYFAEQVSEELSNYFKATPPNDGGAVTITGFKNTVNIITALKVSVPKWWSVEDVDATEPAYDAIRPTGAELDAIDGRVGTDNKLLAEFPFNFNLPRGASYVNYDATHKVLVYPQTFNTSSMGTSGTYNATNYYYPPELLYFGNSPIRVNDNEKRNLSNFADADNWVSDTKWTADGWKSGTNGVVQSSTRAVAMQNEINYGLALLETKVQFKDAVLEDNRHNVAKIFNTSISDAHVDNDPTKPYQYEPNNEIAAAAGLFELTGIIIGGVSQNVGWDYLPYYEVDENNDLTDKMVYGFLYDKAIAEDARAIPATGTSTANYTLVFDNFKWTTQSAAGIFDNSTTQSDVAVALEFHNLGEDFYGNYNLIRNDGYFYLIGTLKPNATSGSGSATTASKTGIKWDAESGRNDGHVIPPYNADGTSMKIPRVFIQDHKTSVTFSLTKTSLQHAYLTVPDLRSTSLSLGLDVDLNWESGLTFDDVELGD